MSFGCSYMRINVCPWVQNVLQPACMDWNFAQIQRREISNQEKIRDLTEDTVSKWTRKSPKQCNQSINWFCEKRYELGFNLYVNLNIDLSYQSVPFQLALHNSHSIHMSWMAWIEMKWNELPWLEMKTEETSAIG